MKASARHPLRWIPALVLAVAACAASEAANESAASEESASSEVRARRTVDENGDSVWVSADGDTLHTTSRYDPDYVRARQEAQCSLHEFRRRLVTRPATQTELAFKARIEDSVEFESAWFEALELVGDTLVRGELEVTPVLVRGIRRGDTLTFPFRAIQDWMADDRDTVVGGFSMRVIRDRMNRAQRARHDSASGYRFGADSANWLELVAGCHGAKLLGAAGP